MKGTPATSSGKTYKYILSLMDVFSRYHWLRPLQTKTSKEVAKALRRIYSEHGIPLHLQSDNGNEFKKDVKEFCRLSKIKMIRCRPYHPQSQGKVSMHKLIGLALPIGGSYEILSVRLW